MASPLKSPGVSLREIDVSGPTALAPQGIPAGVVGTAQKGRAFVPVTFATYQDFIAEFGESDGERFGPLAVNEWMKNSRSGAYVRVLGIGDGKKRTADGENAGRVNNAGFVVGSSLVQSGGLVAANPFANNTEADAPPPGRTHFLSSFLRATSLGSAEILNDALGDELITEEQSYPILRGIIFAASGVNISLATDAIENNTPDPTAQATFALLDDTDAGASHGKVLVEGGKQTFIMLLNGHKPSDVYNNVITASFDPTAADYFANVFNTDPLKIQEAGHLLYAHYDVHPAIAVPGAVGALVTNIDEPGTSKTKLITEISFDRVPADGTTITLTDYTDTTTVITFVSALTVPAVLGEIHLDGIDNAGEAAAALDAKITALGALDSFFEADVVGSVVTVTGETGIDILGNVLPSVVLDGVIVDPARATTEVTTPAATGVDPVFDITFLDVPLAGSIIRFTTGDGDIETLTFVAGAAVPGEITLVGIADAAAAAEKLSEAINATDGIKAYFSAVVADDIVVITGDNTPEGSSTPSVEAVEPDSIVDSVTQTPVLGVNSVTTVTFSSVPSAGTAIQFTRNTGVLVTVTFVAAAAGPNEITLVGVDNANEAAAALAVKINALGALEDFFEAVAVGSVVTVTGFVGFTDDEGTVLPVLAAETTFDAALLLTGNSPRNTVLELNPNYENFEDRFRTAATPWFISQKFGGRNKRLFKIHSLDDGAAGNGLFKITIENIAASNNLNYKYGTFDLLVRDFNDTDIDPVVLESFRGLSLDPTSARFISRVIGDTHAFYDLDQSTGRQKLRVEGSFSNASRYIRVETDVQVQRGGVVAEALPVGFAGFAHTNTAGSIEETPLLTGDIAATSLVTLSDFANVKELPVPMRTSLSQGTGLAKKLNSKLTWGVQFETQSNPLNLNSNAVINKSIMSFAKYFPDFQTGGLNFLSGDNSGSPALGDGNIVVDCDEFNKNKFSLENVQVVKTLLNKADSSRWSAAVYRRNGVMKSELTASDGTVFEVESTRMLDPAIDFSDTANRQFLKFTCMAQGGFDGFNIFDREKSHATDLAARREFDDEISQGGVLGSTIASFRKAIDVLGEKTDVDIQLLAIPGMRHPSITDYAIDAVENRFDAMYIMDVEEKDQENAFMTGSLVQIPSVTYTVDNFKSRNLDTSFAAAYYPDLIINDPATRTNIQVPPSVAVLGAFSLNDATAYPWFAPAGFTRGALYSVLETQVKLSRANMDSLYDADINPVTSFADSAGVVVFGQKTLQKAQTSLDRVNVRRLLISIRRRVRRIAESFIFEPNRAETLARFSRLVTPVLQQIQSQNGVERFKVQIDTSTTTQADVENNTVRGKIFVQPTRAVEFISLDFVISNQGANI